MRLTKRVTWSHQKVNFLKNIPKNFSGLKIVLDFVLNHSSNQHDWFLKSLLREEPYSDYYVWEDPIGFDDDGVPIPPTNWVSAFRGSMWEFREERQQFYLHQYLVEQPDLNYRNPLILEEMKDVLKFWLDIGVDGFRLDAVRCSWNFSPMYVFKNSC